MRRTSNVKFDGYSSYTQYIVSSWNTKKRYALFYKAIEKIMYTPAYTNIKTLIYVDTMNSR